MAKIRRQRQRNGLTAHQAKKLRIALQNGQDNYAIIMANAQKKMDRFYQEDLERYNWLKSRHTNKN